MVESINDVKSLNVAALKKQMSDFNETKKLETNKKRSFEQEDQALISAQSKLLNEMERFNSGEGNIVDMSTTIAITTTQVDAAIKIMKVKYSILKDVMSLGEK